jgi:DNA-binding NtrC family response regulator
MQKILIIDDDEDIGRGLEINLSKEGYKPLRANNGQSGIDSAIKNNPDLVLLDVAMPARTDSMSAGSCGEKDSEAHHHADGEVGGDRSRVGLGRRG